MSPVGTGDKPATSCRFKRACTFGVSGDKLATNRRQQTDVALEATQRHRMSPLCRQTRDRRRQMIMKTFRPERREPMPADRIVRSTWTVGRRTVTVVQDVSIIPGAIGQLRAEWEPDPPRQLSKREWREYRAGRDAHWQRIANIIGGAVACAEP